MDGVPPPEPSNHLAGLDFVVVAANDPAALAALGAYFGELDARFAGGFDPGDTTADAPAYRSPQGAFLLARTATDTAACGGFTRFDATTAEIKRMWVAPAWRGVRVGRRILEELERLARARGYDRVVLDTNDVLDRALHLYAAAGYDAIPRYNDNPYATNWFAKSLRD